MERVFSVDLLDGSGRSFGELPKRLAIFCCCVQRVSIKELQDVVPVNFIKHFGGYLYCVVKAMRLIFYQCFALSQHLNVRRTNDIALFSL